MTPEPNAEFLPAPLQQGGTVDLMPTESVERMFKMAKLLAASGMFGNVTQAEQAFAKMVIGYHLGLNPAQAMMGIQIVRGNVQMSYPLMGAFVKSRKGYDYKIKEHDNDHAVIDFFRDGELLGTATFTVEDAKRAKLIKDNGGWQTYPENMCVARALSKGVRFFMPEALGGLPVYTTGEVPAQEELTSGEGSGEAAPEVELPPEVQAVIERAEKLENSTWADVSTWTYRVKMGKGNVHEGSLAESLKEANADLDAAEAITDAEEVPDDDPDVPIDTEGLPPVPETPAERGRRVMENANTGRTRSAPTDLGGETSEAKGPMTPEQADPGPVPSSEGVRSESPPQTSLGGGQPPPTDSLVRESVGTDAPSKETPAAQEPSEEMAVLIAKRKAIEEMPADDEEEQAEKDEALEWVDNEIAQLAERENPSQGSLL